MISTRGSRHLILMLLIGLMALFLSGCGTSPVRVEQRATDLELLKLGVHQLTQPRVVPGPIQHPDQAETTEQVWNLSLDLDDVHWLGEGDKVRVRDFVDQAVKLIAESRMAPCKLWQFKCKSERAKALEAFKVAPQGK